MKRKPWPLPTKKKETLLQYFRGLVCTQGQGVGKPIKVFPWEREFLAQAFKREEVREPPALLPLPLGENWCEGG